MPNRLSSGFHSWPLSVCLALLPFLKGWTGNLGKDGARRRESVLHDTVVEGLMIPFHKADVREYNFMSAVGVMKSNEPEQEDAGVHFCAVLMLLGSQHKKQLAKDVGRKKETGFSSHINQFLVPDRCYGSIRIKLRHCLKKKKSFSL